MLTYLIDTNIISYLADPARSFTGEFLLPLSVFRISASSPSRC